MATGAPRSPEDEVQNRWFFTKEQLLNSPSRSDGVDVEKELAYRQQAASLIKNMGDSLKVNALCISTAVVYMHRFFMMQSFKGFDRSAVSIAALFLAAKVEEQPRRLEVVAKVAYSFLNKDSPPLDTQSESYTKIIDDVTHHEIVILQTLGFEVAVEHPHPHVAVCTDLIKVSKDLIQTAYFLAHNSQLVTTFCLQHKPTLIAAVCIHLTCKWKGLKIPLSSDNKNWWEYIDKDVSHSQLEDLAREFLTIIHKCPRHIKKRITDSLKATAQQSKGPSGSGTPSSSKKRDKPSSSSASTSAAAASAHPPSDHHRPGTEETTAKHAKHSNSSHHGHHSSKSHQHSAASVSARPHKVQGQQLSASIPEGSLPGSSRSVTQVPPSAPPHSGHNSQHHGPVKHKPSVPGSLSLVAGQKHTMSNPSLPQKHKRLKTEDHSHSNTHRQSLSLEDYRRKHHSSEVAAEKKHQSIELKIEPITPSTPVPGYSNLSLKAPSNRISDNWSVPPLPPPLPSHDTAPFFPPPPPPPPPPSSSSPSVDT